MAKITDGYDEGGYTEKVSEYARTLQTRAHQAAFRARHPNYHKKWKERVGYPTTADGRRKGWRSRTLPPTTDLLDLL